jgi:hypothetical protein
VENEESASPVDALEAAVNNVTSGALQRSVSIESTASEQSFVQRMKAKYAQDKEARNNIGNTVCSTVAQSPTIFKYADVSHL